MKGKALAFILLAVLLSLFATPVYAQSIPSLPHAFYGAVTINGSPAPIGTKVEARGEGVQTGTSNNPIVITLEGQYGGSDPLASKLIVQGDVAEGTALTFYVNGVKTDQTAEWHSGEVTELGVTATISGSSATTEPTPQPTPQPAPAPAPQPTPQPAPAPAPQPTLEPTPQPTPEASPAPAPSPAPPTSPAPSSATSPINWPVLLAVLGGVAVLGIIILIVAIRRSY